MSNIEPDVPHAVSILGTLFFVNLGKVMLAWMFLIWFVKPILEAFNVPCPEVDFYMAFAGLMFVKLVLLNKLY